ncbi:MAG: hypothetical protein K6A81_02250 [Clostridiales bacterium]|nr:hypothetical protein [Clostridiales bacterium]
MKKKILVLTMAMALILTSACGSKENSKDKKDKNSTTKTEETEKEENEEKETEAPEETPGSTTEATTTEAPTETTEETTTEAPTETTERDESECIYDISSMTAEEIADLCDSLTQREIPKVGDLYSDVKKNYYDVEPWRYTQAFCGRYGGSDDKDNVNCIYVSGVYVDGVGEDGGPVVRNIDRFGTGIVIDIYDYAKAEEFIKIMKERHPIVEEKPDGSWRGEDFIVGITPCDFFSLENGIHFQIAYGEHSDWYEAVSGLFGFGFEITVADYTETQAEA